MEMLPAAERPRVFLSASAIGFYGDRGDLELNECAAAGEGYLAAVCQAWEQEVLRANKLDVRTVAVRVGIVLGRGGGALEKMLRPFRLGVGGRLGSGRQWMSWIHVEDLVSMFVFLLGCEDARGAVNGVGPNPVTNSDFTKALAGALQRPALCSVPAVALRVLLGEMSSILLASQRVVPAMAERLGFSFCFPTLASALDNLCSDASREIIREFWLARPPEQVFRFFSNPRNLERITPDFLRFRVLGTNTAEVGEGTLIDYRLALHGLPLRWQSRIESWQPNRSFVDVQVRGPYRVWHHTHEFEPADGGTIVRDRVRYALPFGPLGELFGGPFVAKDLDAIFDFRRERITEALA
jgi:ligand-binding SRPBCC domain-containing protein